MALNLPNPGQNPWAHQLNAALTELDNRTSGGGGGGASFILLDPLDPLPAASSIPPGTLVLRRLADD